MAFGGCHSREGFKNLNAVTEAIYKALPSGSLSIHKSVVAWNSMGMWFSQAPYQSLGMVQKNRSMSWDRTWDTWKRKEVPESGCSVGRSSMGGLQDETTNQWSGKAFFGSMLWMGESRQGRGHSYVCVSQRGGCCTSSCMEMETSHSSPAHTLTTALLGFHDLKCRLQLSQ